MYFVGILLVVLAGVHHVYPLITVSSSMKTDFGGEVCPQTVQFTCVAIDIEPTLVWGFNALASDSMTFQYVFVNDMSHTFPRTVLQDDNVTFVIVSAVQNQQNMDRANITSTLTVSLSTLIYFNVQRIVCGTLLENGNYELSLDGVTVRAPPPRPVFTCSIADDGGSVTFNWNSGYNSDYSVNLYRLQSDTLTCSANDISPNTSYICGGLRVGEMFMINLTAFNCDMQQGAIRNFFIDLQREPEPPSIVEVVSVFNSSALMQVTVIWSVNGHGHRYSNKCDHKETAYTVILQNDLNPSIEQEVDLENCEDSICSTGIPISDPNGTYSVSVSTVSILGTNSVMFHSMIPANATLLLRSFFDFSNCITYVTCSSDLFEEGNCDISYSSSSDSGSVVGMLNSRRALPVLATSTEYKFLTNITLNSSFIIKVQQSFMTGEFDPRLTSSNIGMIVVGILFIVTAIAVTIVLILFLGGCTTCVGSHDDEDAAGKATLSRGPEKYLSCVVCTFAIILTLVLWFSYGGVVGQQENTCEVSWQMSRDSLVATALFFSIITLFVSFGSLICVWRMWDRKLWKAFRDLSAKKTVTTQDRELSEYDDIVIEDTGKDNKEPPCSDDDQYVPVSATPINLRKVDKSKELDKTDKNADELEEHNPVAHWKGGVLHEEPLLRRMSEKLFGEQLKRMKEHPSGGPKTEKRVQGSNPANTDSQKEEDSKGQQSSGPETANQQKESRQEEPQNVFQREATVAREPGRNGTETAKSTNRERHGMSATEQTETKKPQANRESNKNDTSEDEHEQLPAQNEQATGVARTVNEANEGSTGIPKIEEVD